MGEKDQYPIDLWNGILSVWLIHSKMYKLCIWMEKIILEYQWKKGTNNCVYKSYIQQPRTLLRNRFISIFEKDIFSYLVNQCLYNCNKQRTRLSVLFLAPPPLFFMSFGSNKNTENTITNNEGKYLLICL